MTNKSGLITCRCLWTRRRKRCEVMREQKKGARPPKIMWDLLGERKRRSLETWVLHTDRQRSESLKGAGLGQLEAFQAESRE